MRAQLRNHPHLEYRPSGFHWRRRLPRHVLKKNSQGLKPCLLFSLRTHVLPDAKALAQKLTLLSDVAFAGVTERTMAIAPDIMNTLLVELCRFLIEAADLAREEAPERTREVADYELACAHAAVGSLRDAYKLRNVDVARQPLRDVAARLGIALDETDPDWRGLALRALRHMREAAEENIERDQGYFRETTFVLAAARQQLDGAPCAVPVAAPGLPMQSPIRMPVGHVPQHLMPQITPRAASQDVSAQVSRDVPTSKPEPEVAEPVAAKQPADSEPYASQQSGLTIKECSEEYISLRSQGYKSFKPTEQANKKGAASWAKNTAPNVRSTTALMTRILGDKRFVEITDSELTAAWELYARIPRTYQAKTSKLSPAEAADQADAQEKRNKEITRERLTKKGASPGKIEAEMLKDQVRRLATATIYRHMQDFQRMCFFLIKTGRMSDNIMEEHIWDSAEFERRKTLEEDNERLTWCGKLDAFFRSPIFQEKLDDVGDPMFWAPLIALHAGLRSEEVLQLYLTDIQVLDDVPCIVLRQGPGQSLKSQAARRTVPIHENLLKLGFMNLVALREREGEPRLFPWLERSENKKTFTENFSKKFTRYRKDHKVYDPQRDFHSFRTTFNHLLIEVECPDTQRRYMMGHVERDIGITNYNPDGFSKALLAKRVNAVKIDVSMIRSPFAEAQRGNVAHLADRRYCAVS